MFRVGELIKRRTLNPRRTQAFCVVVEIGEKKYTVYNNSLKCIQSVDIDVIDTLYSKVV